MAIYGPFFLETIFYVDIDEMVTNFNLRQLLREFNLLHRLYFVRIWTYMKKIIVKDLAMKFNRYHRNAE